MNKFFLKRALFFVNNYLLSNFFLSRIKTKFGSFNIYVTNYHELLRSVTFNDKEPETIRWINNFKPDRGSKNIIFYDIGANIGIYSLYSSLRHKNIQVYAFEPDAQSFGSLCKNIFINKFNIKPFLIAISRKTGIGKVFISIMSAGAGACAFGSEYKFYSSKEIFQQGVFHSSLDDLIFKYKLPPPNYLKIDVDGLEFDILMGSAKTLKLNKIKEVLVEIQYSKESDLTKVFKFLNTFNLYLKEKSNWISSSNGMQSRNFIFTKEAKN
jgi:FkbM family methyltransferase